MHRHGNLWETLTDFPNLLRAAFQARRGKRFRANVARFEFHLERELLRLQEELRSRSYRPGGYRTFAIREPKPRLISAAPYRDRVVHHALCRVLEPVFEPAFIADSYACRPGKGTHAAVDRCQQFARRYRFVLKGDVRKYFPSMDHAVLKGLLRRKLKDPDVLWLADLLIDGSNAQEPMQAWFHGDDLFTPWERRRGLPIGNQTSQFFANVYLNPLDHFAKEVLRARGYLRYMDDFLLFHDDSGWLAAARGQIEDRLGAMRLLLHPGKRAISQTSDGVRFVGYRVFPTHRLLPRAGVTRMKRRLAGMRRALEAGTLSAAAFRQRSQSWLGHAGHADTFGLQRWLGMPMAKC
jgi:retron-type reverse transcriptase